MCDFNGLHIHRCVVLFNFRVMIPILRSLFFIFLCDEFPPVFSYAYYLLS